MKIYIPEFTVDSPDHDKLWCTFWWMIGQNWGFDHMYQFYVDDYKALTPPNHVGVSRALITRFTRAYGKWIQMGTDSLPSVGILRFGNTDWSFVPWECEDPRLQRIWIHLYNAVWCGRELRQDLFLTKTKKDTWKVNPLHTDIDWWNPNHGVRPKDHVPHYLRKPITRGVKIENTFAGKIKIEENE